MKILQEKTLTESKEVLPATFITDFIANGWDSIGYLNADIEALKNFDNSKELTDCIQALVDAYLICIGQMEAHLQDNNNISVDKALNKSENKTEKVDEKEPAEDTVKDQPVDIAAVDPEPAVVDKQEPVIEVPIEATSEIDDVPVVMEVGAPENKNRAPFEYYVDFDDPEPRDDDDSKEDALDMLRKFYSASQQ